MTRKDSNQNAKDICALHTDVFSPDLKLLVLAPHPDDFEAIGVTLKRFKSNGNRITLAVISSGASGVEDSYLANDGNLIAKARIREREQLAGCRFFGLDESDLVFLRCAEDRDGNILENKENYHQIKHCIKKHDPDLIFMPHPNDTNLGHRRSYALVRKALYKMSKPRLLLLNKDPKTISMDERLYTFFEKEDELWKRKLLKLHASQHWRNLRTRGHGFDYRILEFNRVCALNIKLAGYAEVFDFEVTTSRSFSKGDSSLYNKNIKDGAINILVVDDVKINRLVLEFILRKCGCECDWAEDGLDALKKLDSENDYTIIFMDCLMPKLGGYETIQRIRRDERYNGMQIFCTSSMRSQDGVLNPRCEQCPVDGFLNKPFTESEVRSLL